MHRICFLMLLLLPFVGCVDHQTENHSVTVAATGSGRLDSLRTKLLAFASSKQADIGVSILGIEDGDTLSINGDKYYRTMSVAKFPQALLLLHMIDEGKLSKAAPVQFSASDLAVPTGSTFRKDHPANAVSVSIPELLRYSIGQSDNITAVRMFNLQGGPAAVDSYIHSLGVSDIHIVTDYMHMADDSMHNNRTTPRAITLLLHKFHTQSILSDSSRRLLWNTMVAGTSGPNRLRGKLPTGTLVAHKTGTSSTNNSTGITPATNDVGIVQLPNGRHFAIAVFVGDSHEKPDTNAEIIADICKETYDYFMGK